MPDESTLPTPEVAAAAPAASAVIQGPVSEVKKVKAAKRKTQDQTQETKDAVPAPKLVLWDTGKDPELVKLPLSPSDPRWDDRMRLKLVPSFVERLAEETIRTPLDVSPDPDGEGYVINDGRTRRRAIPEANALRKKQGLPPLVVPLMVRDEDELEAMGIAVSLNEGTIKSPATVKASGIERLLSAGMEERDVCKRFGISSQTMHTYLGLLTLPKKVQDLVDNGTLSMAAAVKLVHLDEKKVESAAEQIVKAQTLGVKTTAAQVENIAKGAKKRSASGRLGSAYINNMLGELKKADLKGKHGDAVRKAAILALELTLDGTKFDEFLGELDSLAKA